MLKKTKYSLTLIIPIFNEYEGIPFLVESLNRFFVHYPEMSVEVIFVNDGSKDDSLQRLLNTKHTSYDAKVISLSKNFGSHAALRAGILHASGELVCFNYADLQDPLELIPRMKKIIESGHDIVWAHRNSTKISFMEKAFSGAYAYLMKKFAFPDFPEKGFDIVMFNYKVRDKVNENVEANSSVFLQILGMGFRQTAISYDKKERRIGKSKWTVSKKIKLLIDSFVAFSFAPIRLVSIIGIAFFILGFLWSMYIVFRKIVFNDLASGWPALLSILMIGFGTTNISLGIIAEYLWRTLDASRKRPVFIIDEVLEISKETELVYSVK